MKRKETPCPGGLTDRELDARVRAVQGEISGSPSLGSAFESMLDGIDAFIFVTDIKTDEVLYANGKMAEMHSAKGELCGRKCWQILRSDMDGRCPTCPVFLLAGDTSKVIRWEEHLADSDTYYDVVDRLITWTDGRLVHLQQRTDITQARRAQDDIRRRLAQQQLMSSISHSFISTESMPVLIQNALRMTGEFLECGKIVIAALKDGFMEYQYGWHNESLGIPPPHPTRMPFAPGNPFYDYFIVRGEQYFACDDISKAPELSMFASFGIKSVLSVAIYVKGELWGVITVDSCIDLHSWSESDIALMQLIVSVISALILRNDMERQLVEAKELAEQGSRAKGDFLSRMSHEMRTPMNAIIGMTGIAQSTDSAERKEYCLEKINIASRHLLGVINDILDMSKIEAGKVELSPSEFDFERMLIKVANVVGFRADEKEQNLLVNISPDVPQALFADEQRISQIVTNLLSNAIKFTPEKGTVTLSASLEREHDGTCIVRISVSDTGIGLSPEQQARLFRSFEQADGGVARRFGGTGLGLAISKSLVELLGGQISVESEIDRGSTFSFTFCAQRRAGAAHSLLGPDISWSNIRALVVDDAPEVLEYFANIAKSLKIECDFASDGEQACRMLEENVRYNICFIDWKMPGMSGIELTRHIKSRCGSDTVVIMISATEWSAIESEARHAGVDKYLAKPLFASSIADIINECMGSHSRSDRAGEPDLKNIFAGRRVLLAEDNEINREIVLTLLEPTGVRIDCAEDGLQAVEMFGRTSYDLVFMDIHMPQMDGYEATRRIRALGTPAAESTPIIAMTANVFREDIERCLAAGMDSHVGKPIELAEVIENMRRYLTV